MGSAMGFLYNTVWDGYRDTSTASAVAATIAAGSGAQVNRLALNGKPSLPACRRP